MKFYSSSFFTYHGFTIAFLLDFYPFSNIQYASKRIAMIFLVLLILIKTIGLLFTHINCNAKVHAKFSSTAKRCVNYCRLAYKKLLAQPISFEWKWFDVRNTLDFMSNDNLHIIFNIKFIEFKWFGVDAVFYFKESVDI